MKRMIFTIIPALVAILMGNTTPVSLQAQEEPAVTVTIPFAFSADGQEMPAGTYRFNLVDDEFQLSIRNVKTGRKRLLMVYPDRTRSREALACLVFHHDEEGSVLSEVHIPGTDTFSRMLPPHGQRNIAASSCAKNESTTIALK